MNKNEEKVEKLFNEINDRYQEIAETLEEDGTIDRFTFLFASYDSATNGSYVQGVGGNMMSVLGTLEILKEHLNNAKKEFVARQNNHNGSEWGKDRKGGFGSKHKGGAMDLLQRMKKKLKEAEEGEI